jgi:MFS family permease
MWRLGFVFHEMASGLLSVFLPLYIVTIDPVNALLDIGIMSAVAVILAIPASFLWGYICDKTRHYKRYILLSFLSLAVILYLFTLTSNVWLLIVLYALFSILHVAHEPPKNVLVAELYPREEWEKTFAFYEGFTEIGWLAGLLLGFFLSAMGLTQFFSLPLCSSLNLAAFILTIFLVNDPVLIFERGLVAIEKTMDFIGKGVSIVSKIMYGFSPDETFREENINAFCCGLILFSLATSTIFTPLPVFFSRELAIPQSLIFELYALNSTGSVLAYFIAGQRSDRSVEKSALCRIAIFRSMLVFFLMVTVQLLMFSAILIAIILFLMGFLYALFLIYTLALSMEIMPEGKAGLFNVLISLGGAFGSFIGPFLADEYGFAYTILVSGVTFLFSFAAFKIF